MALFILEFALNMPYIPIKATLVALILTIIVLILLPVVEPIVRASLSSARILPGPSGGNFVLGHLDLIQKSVKGDWYERLVKEYGHVLRYRTFLGTDRIFTTDPKALHHILSNTSIYHKIAPVRYHLGQFVGQGLLTVEGPEHKRQRRIINPAFSSGNIKEMTEIFLSKAQEMCDVLLAQLQAQSGSTASPSARVDMLVYLTQATLDIIGLAGFNYPFNALANEQSELSNAFDAVLHPPEQFPYLQFFKLHIPILRHILKFDKVTKYMNAARSKMDNIGRDLVERKKQEILEEKAAGDEVVRKSKDLLSLLIRSNMNEKGGGLTENEVLHQIPTFLLAGHETTSTSTTWALFTLASYPDIQSRLRSELLLVHTDSPQMGELDKLPYLDAVVREALRFHAVIDGAIRVAIRDDIVPFEKPFVARDGKPRDTLKVSKGDSFLVHILMMNVAESIWGPDGREFNPERWLNQGLPKTAQATPSAWGNQLTFLAGPHACIGSRFAVIEIKALLFTLIRGFEFDLAVPKEEIVRNEAVIARPVVKSEIEKGGQMPMIIRPVSQVV